MENVRSAPNFLINCRGKLLDLKEPKILGILNVTPDSFSDGGQFNSEKEALRQAEKMVTEGADILDIGAQSTRPGAEKLTAADEIARLGTLISLIKKEFPETLISLDTFYSDTVLFGFDQGIDIINDISGGFYDKEMIPAAGRTGLPYILMHNNANYEKMHEVKTFDDLLLDLNFYFSERIQKLRNAGVKDIILDPGFGFGKTVEQQHQLINELNYLSFGRYPVLAGISRKSFIYKPLGKKTTEINTETQKLHRTLLKNGAKILRVHDVAQARTTIQDFLVQSR
ncbi:dihydropteroate synthase [Chryseobacterium salipaludis]|uniref:dihydropteroate synthase n=1 Tax=Chryseobacterium TaxID=59732 RepID=UPI001FF46F9E|nr:MULTISPECIES: dihydropteroate synthase [Chryseobacterium]MCJ8497936.1 dihydropteroate synthase [Chryseobacterium salipaludis]MCX3296865.1 dihydropteroate synthase [Planobacterium sp. JC490]